MVKLVIRYKNNLKTEVFRSFEEGLAEAIKRIEGIPKRQILVAIYGLPNSGKSHLIGRIKHYFKERGKIVCYTASDPEKDSFKYIGTDDPIIDIFLFHCSWDRGSIIHEYNDPSYLSKELGKGDVDLNIGIYNPKLFLTPEGEYDFIISNVNSEIKSYGLMRGYQKQY